VITPVKLETRNALLRVVRTETIFYSDISHCLDLIWLIAAHDDGRRNYSLVYSKDHEHK